MAIRYLLFGCMPEILALDRKDYDYAMVSGPGRYYLGENAVAQRNLPGILDYLPITKRCNTNENLGQEKSGSGFPSGA